MLEQIAFQLVEKYGPEELEKLIKYLGMLLHGVKGAAPEAVAGPTGTAVDGLVANEELTEAAADDDDDDDADADDDAEDEPAPAKKAPAKRAARTTRTSKASAKAAESADSADDDDEDMDF